MSWHMPSHKSSCVSSKSAAAEETRSDGMALRSIELDIPLSSRQASRLRSPTVQQIELRALAQSRAAHRDIKYRPGCMIDPRTSRAVPIWDIITSVALIFTALVTPFEVGFLPAATSAAEFLFILNRLIDAVFLTDLVLQFFLMYPLNEGREGARWVADRQQIAQNYLHGWFTLDALSIAVSGFDYLSLGTDHTCPGADKNSLQNLKVLRTLRALRLIKLIRLLRASRMLRRWEVRIAVNYSLMSLAKCVVGLVLLSHWFACVRGLVAGMQDSILHSWVGDDLYCRNITVEALPAHYADGAARFGGGPLQLSARDKSVCEVQCDGPGVLYVAALHWSVMCVLGEADATAGNTGEMAVATLLMLFGSMAWGQVIATFVTIVSTLHPEIAEVCPTR